jgi:hypothetical protein
MTKITYSLSKLRKERRFNIHCLLHISYISFVRKLYMPRGLGSPIFTSYNEVHPGLSTKF